MINLSEWINTFLAALNQTFGHRVWFVGLQGSYARGDATENSDIDTVVILDSLSPADLTTYNNMLNTLPHRELLCGFLSGKEELLNWDPSDLIPLYCDTTPIKGSLDELLPLLNPEAIDRAVKIGVCNIYHSCIHNMLYDKSKEILKNLYKSASFVLRALCYRKSGNYFRHKNELLQAVSEEERKILTVFLDLKNGKSIPFEDASNLLFLWTQNCINATKTTNDFG